MLASYFYQIDFESNAPSHIIEKYKAHSLLFKSNKVVSILSLKNRFEKDKVILKALLGSFGYFNASTFYTIEKDKNGLLIFHIKLKIEDPFTIENLTFSGITTEEEKSIRTMLRLKKGKIFTEDRLSTGMLKMTYYFKNNGYPFVKIERPQIRLLLDKKTIEVYFTIKKGDKKYFGDVEVQNLEHLNTDFIAQKLHWKKGELYDQRLIENAQKKLTKSGVIGYAHITPLESDTDSVPMKVKIYEAPRRTFLGEAGYSTTDSLRGRASWKHRNLLGNAESLECYGDLSKALQSLQIKSKFPYFIGQPDIAALSELILSHEDTSAYRGIRAVISFGLEKEFGQYVTLGGQLSFDFDHMEKDQITRMAENVYDEKVHIFNTKVLSVPIYFLFNKSNDDLDPTSAFEINTRVEPHFVLDGTIILDPQAPKDHKKPFVVGKIDVSHTQRLYRHRANKQKIVLFNKLSFGNVWGIDRDDLIPHKRLYLGGVRSMRAYGEKKIGEIDSLGGPLGGISSLMWVLELRFRFKNSMGFNLYNEMGFVSKTTLWKSDNLNKLYKGTGASFVYYSKIGPIQFGITCPWPNDRRTFYIKPEKSTEKETKDALLQFYVGIGQI